MLHTYVKYKNTAVIETQKSKLPPSFLGSYGAFICLDKFSV